MHMHTYVHPHAFSRTYTCTRASGQKKRTQSAPIQRYKRTRTALHVKNTNSITLSAPPQSVTYAPVGRYKRTRRALQALPETAAILTAFTPPGGHVAETCNRVASYVCVWNSETNRGTSNGQRGPVRFPVPPDLQEGCSWNGHAFWNTSCTVRNGPLRAVMPSRWRFAHE